MRFVIAMLILLGAEAAWAQADPVRFEAIEIHLDSGNRALAAYQIEFWSSSRGMKIVGVEGGDGPFKEAPFYDPRALQRERIVIAAFAVDPAEKPPGRSIRVATVHVQVTGLASPEYRVKVTTAADSEAKRISAKPALKRTP